MGGVRFRQREQHVEGRGARQGKYTIGGMGIQHQVKRSGGTRGEAAPLTLQTNELRLLFL